MSEQDILSIGRQLLEKESAAILSLATMLDQSFLQAVNYLVNCEGHVIASGVGTTGMIARRFAHLLCNVGCPALFLHSGDSLHGSSGAVRSKDILVLLSKSGETIETIQLAKIVYERHVPIIAITARPESTLGKLSTVVLKVQAPDDIDPYNGLMGVGSSLVSAAMCDALVFAVWHCKGMTTQDFFQGHPGGIIAHLSHPKPPDLTA
ncbi:MAG: Arabinose 5-phosphate isomerase [Anaerolineae bacterium]|jgi:arabinose-5-phosphate isomerase|nr:MAG: Arabinose 5-phosphate isomerase [Anaerolineae bacterium]